MKAEHRKELETNALAERMGRVVQGMKQAPQKRTMLWMVLVAVAVVVVVAGARVPVVTPLAMPNPCRGTSGSSALRPPGLRRRLRLLHCLIPVLSP